MEQTQKRSFPTEEVTLPSKGLLYPKESPLSKGVVEIKTIAMMDLIDIKCVVMFMIMVKEYLKLDMQIFLGN